MKLTQIILEANIAAKLKDPKIIKMLGIAVRHDETLPKHKIAALGPKPEDDQILNLWSEILDQSLSSTNYGNISTDGKFDDWLTRLYINGVVDYEDISGEGGDALGAWKALSIRGKLKPEHQDFNKFKSIKEIQRIVRMQEYRTELDRIKNAEVIENHKREKKETTLIDNERFLITLPYNYGACYTFNNSAGFQASFCTGSSSGLRWFERYAPEGPIISIFDKQNQEDENGKWQMHAPTGQMNNGDQSVTYRSGDKRFSELYPGLMKEIIAAMQQKAEEIKTNSTEITSGGYDVEAAINDIKDKLPSSYASEAPKPEVEPEAEPGAQVDGPGEYLVTHTPTGRQARINADGRDDAQQKLLQRHPNINLDDFTFELQPGEAQ